MADTIRITKDFQNEDGFSFWKGETFIPCMENTDGGDPYRDGTEVKVMGEYTFIEPGTFEVVR